MTRKERIQWYQKMDERGAMRMIDRWKYLCWCFCPVLWLVLPGAATWSLYRGYSLGQIVLIEGLTLVVGAAVALSCAMTSNIANLGMPDVATVVIMPFWIFVISLVIGLSAVVALHYIGVFV